MEQIRTLVRRFLLALVLAVIVFPIHSLVAQINVPEKLKAAYILSFAKLIEWPKDTFHSSSTNLVLCAAATESLINELRNHSGKTIQGHKVLVRALSKHGDAIGCHIIYVDIHHSSRWFKRSEPTVGQLLIGEEKGFIQKGGVINFFVDGEKLRFEISPARAKYANLEISSRLLNLAKIVEAKK